MAGDSFEIDSPRAGGAYVISQSCMQSFGAKNFDERQKSLLTSWLIQDRARGERKPQIPTSTKIESFVKRLHPLPIHRRADNLLKYIDSEISNIADIFVFEMPSPPNSGWERYEEMLAWSESLVPRELMYLVTFLQDEGWLERSTSSYGDGSGSGSGKIVQGQGWQKRSGFDDFTEHRFSITVAGYSHLTELKTRTPDSAQAFVAMWLDDSMNQVWSEGLEPAIKDAGYNAMRIDKKEHVNKIDDEIIAEIRRSKFLVVDFTQGDSGARGSVYYEAGFAHGLDIPVIFTCRKDCLNKIHFDARQYSCIVWNDHDNLKSRLTKRISAVLGDGPDRGVPD